MGKDIYQVKSDNEDICFGTTKENEITKVDEIIELEYFKKRIIFIDEEISDELANSVIKKIKLFEQISSSLPITLMINSDGGDIYEALAIYDVIQLSPCMIRTIAVGKALSAAAWLLLSGTPGERYAYPNTRIMIHEGSTFLMGDDKISDLEVRNNEVQLMHKQYINILKKHTKIDKDYKQIKDWLSKDIYMSSEEAKNFGIIDNVIESRKES